MSIQSFSKLSSYLLKSSATNAVQKITVITVSLIIFPLLSRYLGPSDFGYWIILSTVYSFLTLSDLGISAGLVNELNRCSRAESNEKYTAVIQTAFIMLTGVSIVITVLVLLSSLMFSIFFKNSFSSLLEIDPGIVIAGQTLVFMFLISLPFTIFEKILLAERRFFEMNASIIVGSLFGAGLVYLLILANSSIEILVIGMAAGPLVGYLACLFSYRRKLEMLTPSNLNIDHAAAISLIHDAKKFFPLSLLSVFINNIDIILVGVIFGAIEAGVYGVLRRIFQVGQIGQYFITPLWPVFSMMLSESKFRQAYRVLNRALLTTVTLSIIAVGIIVLFVEFLFEQWFELSLSGLEFLPILFAVFSVLQVASGTLSIFMSHTSFLGYQLKIYAVFSLVSSLMAAIMGLYYGIYGLQLGFIIGLLFFFIAPAFLIIRWSINECAIKSSS